MNKVLKYGLSFIVLMVVSILLFAPRVGDEQNNAVSQNNKKDEKKIELKNAILKQNIWFTCKDKYINGKFFFNAKVYVDNSLLINGVYYQNIGKNTWKNDKMKFRINTLYDDTELIIDDYNQKRSVYCNFEYK